jgi:peptidoglycan/LPS O-acetylase OafA/YrhL
VHGAYRPGGEGTKDPASTGGPRDPLITWFRMSSLTRLSLVSAQSAEPGSPRDRRRLDLDVVRGVAILLALGWHFSPTPSGNAVLDALQWPGRTLGWAGVDLFFVLSGFLLGQLVLREHARTGRFDGRRFTARRALKLWPVLYLFLAVHAVVGSEPWDSYLWQNALHVQNYAGTSLTHLWSLAVEEHFYLALALFFPLLARRRAPVRLLVGVLLGVLVTALALRFVGAHAGFGDVRLQWRTHFRVDSLAAGVLLAVARVHAPRAFERLLRWRWVWAAVTAVGVWFLAQFGKEGTPGTTVGFTVAYVTGAAFLLLLHGAAWVPRAGLLTRPLATLGRYSYGIYIWHVLAAQVLLDRLGIDYWSSAPLAQLAKFGAAIVAGIAATVLVERPMLRLRDRLIPAASRVDGDTPPPAGEPAPKPSRSPEPAVRAAA